jgi:hypothetical protein
MALAENRNRLLGRPARSIVSTDPVVSTFRYQEQKYNCDCIVGYLMTLHELQKQNEKYNDYAQFQESGP